MPSGYKVLPDLKMKYYHQCVVLNKVDFPGPYVFMLPDGTILCIPGALSPGLEPHVGHLGFCHVPANSPGLRKLQSPKLSPP